MDPMEYNLNRHQQVPSTLVNVLSVRDINDNELVCVDNGQHVARGVQEVDNGEPAEMLVVVRQVPARPRETFILTDSVAETYNVDETYSDVR